MKKLEELKMCNFEEIGVEEQRSMKGGINAEDDTVDGGLIGEVEVYGRSGGGSASSNWWQSFYFMNCTGYDSGFYSTGNGSDQISIHSGGGASAHNEPLRGDSPGVYNNHCTISADGIAFMKSWEKGPGGGAALKPYDDNGLLPGGNMTIGWGHLILDGEDFSAGITTAQADSIFMADLQKAINDVNKSVHVSLTQNQFDALVSYSYNIGGLSISPDCLRKLNNGDYAGAAAEMDIVTSNSVELPGLVTRRADERTMFNDGIYYCHN